MDEIRIAPYDPAWPAGFTAERDMILACLAARPLAIEHIGSTAVPGLAAKPVIDIIMLVDDLEEVRPSIPKLEATGYSYWAGNPDGTKFFFVKGLPPAQRRTHHLHVYQDHSEVERHVRFRDRLRTDVGDRQAYENLKRGLAERFATDREAYTDAKANFIAALLAKTA